MVAVDHLPLFRRVWAGEVLAGYQPHCLCGWEHDPFSVAEFGDEGAEEKAQRCAGRHVMLESDRERVRAINARHDQLGGISANACICTTEGEHESEGRGPQVDAEGQDVEGGEPDPGFGVAVR